MYVSMGMAGTLVNTERMDKWMFNPIEYKY